MQRQAWAFIWGVGESEGVLESPVFVAGGRRGRLAGGASAGPPKELPREGAAFCEGEGTVSRGGAISWRILRRRGGRRPPFPQRRAVVPSGSCGVVVSRCLWDSRQHV